MRALLLISLIAACSSEGRSLQDAGPTDAAPSDSGSSDSGVPDEAWSWCPPASDAIADPSYGYQMRVTEAAHFCAYDVGSGVEDVLRNAAMLRLVPGTYPLPAVEGTVPYRVPMCLLDRDGSGSMLGGAGTLAVTFDDFFGDTTLKTYVVDQPITFASESLFFRLNVSVWEKIGMGTPELVLDEDQKHGEVPGTDVYYLLCRSGDCFSAGSSSFYPCPSPGEGRDTTITFDRGTLTVNTHVFAFATGPSSPAALTRASGQLDGIDFEQAEYFELSHRPDHHNNGGGFLVRFDQPIGGACGIKAEIPSRDGSFWIDQPAAWLVDCELETIEELAGVQPGG